VGVWRFSTITRGEQSATITGRPRELKTLRLSVKCWGNPSMYMLTPVSYHDNSHFVSVSLSSGNGEICV
jgi:hypothetical protein